MNDADHEYDCESEDMDCKGPSFTTHHFRKKNILWPWFILAIGFPIGAAWSHYFHPEVIILIYIIAPTKRNL